MPRWPRPVHLSEQVWTDGSGTNPTDPWLRRASWAVVALQPDGSFRAVVVWPVRGRQTIGRAELSALVWVAMCRGATRAVADAQYLHRLFTLIRGRPTEALLQGANGYLWAVLARHLPTEWVKAHLTDEQAVQKGWPLIDVWGSRVADVASEVHAERRHA